MSLAILLLASLALAAPTTGPTTAPATRPGDWPVFHGGGALTGVADDVPGPPYKLKWQYVCNEEERAGIIAGVIVANGLVFVADDRGVVHAIDMQTGKRKWTYESGDSFETAPATDGQRVFVGDLSGKLHAINISDGKKAWIGEGDQPIHASATVVGHRVIVGDDGANLRCYDAATGKDLWTGTSGDRINSTPAYANGLVYVAGCDSALSAYDIDTGKGKHSGELPALTGASAAIAGDRAIVGTDAGHVVAKSLDCRRELWHYELEDEQMLFATPAVADGIAVVGGRDRNVHAIDIKTGKKIWIFATRGDVDSSAVISARRVYVGSRDRKFYVLDLKSGNKLWEYQAAKGITAAPAIAHGLIFFADLGGNVYCFEPEKR